MVGLLLMLDMALLEQVFRKPQVGCVAQIDAGALLRSYCGEFAVPDPNRLTVTDGECGNVGRAGVEGKIMENDIPALLEAEDNRIAHGIRCLNDAARSGASKDQSLTVSDREAMAPVVAGWKVNDGPIRGAFDDGSYGGAVVGFAIAPGAEGPNVVNLFGAGQG